MLKNINTVNVFSQKNEEKTAKNPWYAPSRREIRFWRIQPMMVWVVVLCHNAKVTSNTHDYVPRRPLIPRPPLPLPLALRVTLPRRATAAAA